MELRVLIFNTVQLFCFVIFNNHTSFNLFTCTKTMVYVFIYIFMLSCRKYSIYFFFRYDISINDFTVFFVLSYDH